MSVLARLRWLAPLAVLVAAMALRIADPWPVQELRLRVFDLFQRAAPRPYTEVPVRVVDIDDASLERIGQWPWPRTRVAELVDDLFALGAAVVVFDVVFAEPDRTSPARIAEFWSGDALTPGLRSALRALPDHDRVLAEAFERGRVVTGFVVSGRPTDRAPESKAGFSYGGDPFRHLPAHPGAVLALPELEHAATGNGSFSVHPDPDGLYRRVPLVFRYRDQLYPSLAMEAIRVAVGASSYGLRTAGASGEASFGDDTGIVALRIGREFTVPTAKNGEIWVWFTERVPERYVPAWKVLAGEADPARIEGHIVLIGTTAAALYDLRPTPLDPVAPGVSVHAQIIEQVLLGEHLVRPDWATGVEFSFLAVLGLLLVVLLPRVGAFGTAALGFGAVAGAFALSWLAYRDWHWLLDPAYPAFACLAVYVVGSLQNYLASEVQRRQVRHAFGRYLSPALVDELASNPERLRLGGEMREMTLLFSDVRGFTTISEQLDPEALTGLINRFLTPMTDLILERRGFIDKYMGDCVMAFWNAPLDDPDHARHACDAALEMLRQLVALNARLRRDGDGLGRPLPPLSIGIGLNTGMCCVGNMGSAQRFDYSVISDEVNLASRLEGQSKTYGVAIVMGENTLAKARGLATLELDMIRVKGKTRPVRIHTLLGDESLAGTPEFQELAACHARMLRAYRAQRWDDAEREIALCLEPGRTFGLDELYGLYAERIADYRATPPPVGWDGVYTAASK